MGELTTFFLNSIIIYHFLIISNFIYNICTYFFGILILRENRDLKKIRSDPKK